MSSFDGIFPHCLGTTITFRGRTQRWLLHYIILINGSYQAAPASTLPAHVIAIPDKNSGRRQSRQRGRFHPEPQWDPGGLLEQLLAHITEFITISVGSLEIKEAKQ